MDEYFYFDIISKDKSIKDFYFGRKISQTKDIITIDGINLDKKKYPLRSQLDLPLITDDYKQNHQIFVINTHGMYYAETSLSDSIRASKY